MNTKMFERRRFLALMGLAVAGTAVRAAEAKREWSVGMTVEPVNGEHSTSEKSQSKRGGSWRNRTNQRTTTKVMSSNKKWIVHVSCAGKEPPAKAKLEVFFIGYEKLDSKIGIVGQKSYDIDLNPAKKTDVEVTSPTMTQTKVTRASQNRRRGGSTKSDRSGGRMSGCVVQLVVNGNVEKTYSTQSSWIEGLHNQPFTGIKK